MHQGSAYIAKVRNTSLDAITWDATGGRTRARRDGTRTRVSMSNCSGVHSKTISSVPSQFELFQLSVLRLGAAESSLRRVGEGRPRLFRGVRGEGKDSVDERMDEVLFGKGGRGKTRDREGS